MHCPINIRFLLYMFVRSASSRPGMQNALRISPVPELTTSGTHLSAALLLFPDAPDYFTLYDVLQLMLNDTSYDVLQLMLTQRMCYSWCGHIILRVTVDADIIWCVTVDANWHNIWCITVDANWLNIWFVTVDANWRIIWCVTVDADTTYDVLQLMWHIIGCVTVDADTTYDLLQLMVTHHMMCYSWCWHIMRCITVDADNIWFVTVDADTSYDVLQLMLTNTSYVLQLMLTDTTYDVLQLMLTHHMACYSWCWHNIWCVTVDANWHNIWCVTVDANWHNIWFVTVDADTSYDVLQLMLTHHMCYSWY